MGPPRVGHPPAPLLPTTPCMGDFGASPILGGAPLTPLPSLSLFCKLAALVRHRVTLFGKGGSGAMGGAGGGVPTVVTSPH